MSCCFGLNTKILMHDGSSKNIQEINKGDYVMGLDGRGKKVLDTYHDFDDMFELSSKSSSNNKKDIKYVVNKRHKLILKNNKNEIIRIKLEDYLKMGNRWKRRHFLLKNEEEIQFLYKATEDAYDMGEELIDDDDSTEIPESFKLNARPVRYELLSGMLANGGEVRDERVYIYHPSYKMCRDIQWVARSLGLTSKIRKVSDNSITQVISDEYQVIIFGKNISEITFLFSKEEIHQQMFKNSNVFKVKLRYLGEGEYFGIKVENDLFFTSEFDIVGS